MHPYLQILYLNHGYQFFAPEPGESTLLAFEAERDDGTVVRGRIPDRTTWPRLLYHRHFMLTEHMSDAPRRAPAVVARFLRAAHRAPSTGRAGSA